MIGRRILAFLVLAAVTLPLASPLAAASPPVSYGKVVAPGVFGVPYATTVDPDFPNSHPSLGTGPLEDGNLVYDTSIGIEIVNPSPGPVEFPVVVEVFDWGTVTQYRNVTTANGSTIVEPVQVPARLDPTWRNATVFSEPFSSGEVVIPLPGTPSTRSLSVTVGEATWSLSTLTPATDSVSGVYTTGGIWGLSIVIAGITAAAILGALALARRLARNIGRSPPVPFWWPALWVAVPFVWFLFGYVSFNQSLGPVSPASVPVPIAIAAYPYLPRLFTKWFDMVEVEGIEPVSLDEAQNPKVTLPLVRTQGKLRCAPATWREAFLSHWVGLPEVRGYRVKLLEHDADVLPRLVPVTNPLEDHYYASDATAACWYDARKGIKRPRHRFRWRREENVPILGPDGVTTTGYRVKRRISPHIERGYLEATFPPKIPVAMELARVRAAEVAEHDHEITRLENADLRGTIDHLSRRYAADSLSAHEEARARQDKPRTREEIERLVERNRRARAAKGGTEGERTRTES